MYVPDGKITNYLFVHKYYFFGQLKRFYHKAFFIGDKS
jgi:hypothetical protein